MSRALWDESPWWKRCEVLHELGMSWREMASICEVKTATLKVAVRSQQEREWMSKLAVIPVPSETPVPREKDWTKNAACKEADVNWFVPSVGKPIDQRARTCCANCSVAQECLEEVLTVVDDCTYRAFTTPRIRRGYRQFFSIEVPDAEDS